MVEYPFIPLRLPAIFVLLVGDGADALDETATRVLASTAGVYKLRPRLFAVLPVPGDPGEVDVAMHAAGRILAEHRPAAEEGAAGAAALVFPGRVRLSFEEIAAIPETLFEDLLASPPPLPPGRVCLTGHAASRIEARWQLEPGGSYKGPSGSQATLFRLGGPRDDAAPWHNARLLGRTISYVARPDIEADLLDHLHSPVVRVSGPFGCGKTRAVWHTLKRWGELGGTAGDLCIWIPIRSPRAGGSLPVSLLRRFVPLAAGAPPDADLSSCLRTLGFPLSVPELLSGSDALLSEVIPGIVARSLVVAARRLGAPIRLIFDGLESAPPAEFELLSRLFTERHRSTDWNAVLISQRGMRVAPEWVSFPEVDVPPMNDGQLAEVADDLLRDLLPEEVKASLLEAVGGCPLALEEGLVRMVQLRQLRRQYGNFFYSGTKGTGYEPSASLVQHLEAWTGALGDPSGLRLLALADTAVPANRLAAAAVIGGSELPNAWEAPFLVAGWLVPTPSPWGAGVEIACPAFARAIASTVDPDAATHLRRALGENLSRSAEPPSAMWEAYQLLSGSPGAVSSILDLARDRPSEVPPVTLLERLVGELEAHRTRGGDTMTEAQILWLLLPLARRLGRLEELENDVLRAVEIAGHDPKKYIAFASLKADLDLKKGRFAEGERILRSALDLVLQVEPGRQALLLLQLGRLLARQERYGEARQLFLDLLPVFESGDASGLTAIALFHLGNIDLHEGRLDEALERHQRAHDIRKVEGNAKLLGSSVSALGAVAFAQGRYAEALRLYREAEMLLRDQGDEGEESFALLGVGKVLAFLGDCAGASRPLRRALALRLGKTDPAGEAIARLMLSLNCLELAQWEEAIQEARQAHFQLSLVPETALLGDAEQMLGKIHLRRKRYDNAREHLTAAADLHARHKDPTGELIDRGYLLEVATAEGLEDEIRLLAGGIEEKLAQVTPTRALAALEHRLFKAREWLRARGDAASRPEEPLKRSLAALMKTAEQLEPELRHRYLFQIPEHRAILEAAGTYQIALPG